MRKCLICNMQLNTPVFVLNNAPSSAQNLPDKSMLNDDKGIDLKLCKCERCGLVQLDVEPVSYYKDVIRAGGFNRTLRELRRKQYDKLIDKYGLAGKRIIEVGCGQGEFIEVLKEFPVEVYGIEHNTDLVKIAIGKGLNVKKGFIENENDLIEDGPYDAFLSFNFLEHQPHPVGMLKGIYNNLKADGIGLITVPSFEYILENNSYYELIRDHLAYYTFDSLNYLCNMCGFEVLESDMINRDTLSVVVRKKRRYNIDDLNLCYEKLKTEFFGFCEKMKAQQKNIYIWGASHQGFTLCSSLQCSDYIEGIIDSAPFKQGKYAPASHIQIISPEDAKNRQIDCIIITAPGYTKEIAGIIRKEFNADIKILTIMTDRLQKVEEIF